MSRLTRALRSALLELWVGCKEPLTTGVIMLGMWAGVIALGWLVCINPPLPLAVMTIAIVLYFVWEFFCVARKHYHDNP